MTDTWAEDVYRELRTLIQVYANIEQKKEEEVVWCPVCRKNFEETVSQHITRHMGAGFRTSTPPPRFG